MKTSLSRSLLSLMTLLSTASTVSAQTPPHYVGQVVIPGARQGFLTDNGTVYGFSNFGKYTTWFDGKTTVHDTTSINADCILYGVSEDGTTLWSRDSVPRQHAAYLQYPDGGAKILYTRDSMTRVVPKWSLSPGDTVVIAANRKLNRPAAMFISPPSLNPSFFLSFDGRPEDYEFDPCCVNRWNRVAGLIKLGNAFHLAIYRFVHWPYPQPSDFDIVETPTYQWNGQQYTYSVEIATFNDNGEVTGKLVADFGCPSYSYVYLPQARYGLTAGYNLFPLNGVGEAVKEIHGFNNRGHLLTNDSIWQYGAWFSLASYLGNPQTRILWNNNAGQILMDRPVENAGEVVHSLHLLTQVVDVRSRFANNDNKPVVLSVRFLSQDGSPGFTRTVTTDAHGDFVLADVPTRAYWLYVSAPRKLTRRFEIDATQSNEEVILAYFGLTPGDANEDNVVDVIDLLLVINHFNQRQGGGNYLAACDFNDDGAVDVADLLTVIRNYRQVGE